MSKNFDYKVQAEILLEKLIQGHAPANPNEALIDVYLTIASVEEARLANLIAIASLPDLGTKTKMDLYDKILGQVGLR